MSGRYPKVFVQGASTYVIGTADTDVALSLAAITPETHTWSGTIFGAFVKRQGMWAKASDCRTPKDARPGVCFLGPIRAKAAN